MDFEGDNELVDTVVWSYRKNARHLNPKKDVRKAVSNKTKRKTKNEMAG
jgi:hypothetical protein